jgi:hypothetical protein
VESITHWTENVVVSDGMETYTVDHQSDGDVCISNVCDEDLVCESGDVCPD